MAKHIGDKDVERCVELLDGWLENLTWEALCEACGPVIGTVPSRQTLYRFVRIKNAYKAAKARLRNGVDEVKLPQSIRVAAQRIARLERENERLNRENRELLQQFTVWQYNAIVKGLTKNDLNKALPRIDRGNTE